MTIKKSIIIESASFLLIVLFIYASTSKLFDYQNFQSQLGRSPMLARYSSLYWIVPAIEIAISGFLAVPKYRLLGLYASFCMMTIFTAYIIAILNYSDYIPCSCGGVLQHMTWKMHLWFNIVFVIIAAVAVVFSSEPAFVAS